MKVHYEDNILQGTLTLLTTSTRYIKRQKSQVSTLASTLEVLHQEGHIGLEQFVNLGDESPPSGFFLTSLDKAKVDPV